MPMPLRSHPTPYDPKKISAMRFPLRVGEVIAGLEDIQNYLRRFNFDYESLEDGVLDHGTLKTLRRFQRHFGLEPKDEFDHMTAKRMAAPRCGLPDFPVAFRTRSKWNQKSLKYALLTSGCPSNIAASAFEAAVASAFQTWANAGAGLTFRKVDPSDAPNIQIEWRPTNDPDYSMQGGVVGHSDLPPPDSLFTPPGSPLPLHLDMGGEHKWEIGAVSAHFDVETIVLHEIGHCLGLLHSGNARSVMFSGATTDFTLRELHADDVAALLSLYNVNSTGPSIALQAASGHFVGLTSGSDARLTASLGKIDQQGQFKEADLGGDKIALLAPNGKYVCAEPDGRLVADREIVREWETFLVIRLGGQRIALRTAHGRYVGAEGGGGGRLIADRAQVDGSSTFNRIPIGV